MLNRFPPFSVYGEASRKCPHCSRVFAQRVSLRRHLRRSTCQAKSATTSGDTADSVQPASFSCDFCSTSFNTHFQLSLHRLRHTHTDDRYSNGSSSINLLRVAVNNVVRDYRMEPSHGAITDFSEWFHQDKIIIEALFNNLNNFRLKALIYLNVNYIKMDHRTGQVLERRLIAHPSSSATEVVDCNSWLSQHIDGLKLAIDKFCERDSDLIFDGVEFADFKVTLLENHSGQGSFKLPSKLKTKSAVVNVDCESHCFKYAVLSILHYEDVETHRYRPSQYKAWEDELKFDEMDASNMKIKDIEKFERLNNIKIIVHIWDKGLKGVRYNRRSSTYDRVINLLLIYNEQSQIWHYCGITNLSRLYYHQLSKHHIHLICNRCIRSFKSKEKFETHYEWCSRGKLQVEKMPKDIYFNYRENGDELSPVRVIYADIECYIDDNTHKPAAIACYEVWHKDLNRQNKIHVWQGEDCILKFLNFLESAVKSQHAFDDELSRKAMNMTAADKIKFDTCEFCPRCSTKFDETVKKVRDHDHLTGQYRNALCSKCNFRLRLRRRVLPVIFHNFKGYDSHIIIKGGLAQMKNSKFDVIAQTREKFMAMTVKVPVDKTKENKTIFFDIKFLDSFQFMASSLASLANNLDQFPATETLRKEYPNLTNEIIKRKGVFPYAYFNKLSKLDKTCLPSIEKFKNDLSGEDCSPDEYHHAQLAWNQFHCKTFGDYMTAYLKLDVFLLADVFEAFRRMALDEDKLDPVHFVSLPAMSFKSAFKMTKETIHLLSDPEMYNLFERGIRGGLTFVNCHYIKSETVGDEHVHLKYIDNNNNFILRFTRP